MPLVTEICIQNFKFELIAPTAVLNRNARSAFDAAPSKNGDFSNAAPPARSLAQLASGRPAQVAGHRFAQWQAESREAIQTLAGSGSLTPLGTTFVEIMAHAATTIEA